MTPEQRRLRARIAANARWSRAMARPDQANAARSAMIARLERQVGHPARASAPDEKASPRARCRGGWLGRSTERRQGTQTGASAA